MFGWLVAGAAAAGSALWLWGRRLPDRAQVSRALEVPPPPEVVWHVVTDWHGQPGWRRELKGIAGPAAVEVGTSWREHHHGGTSIVYRVEECAAPHRLVLRVGEPDAPALVHRTITLTPSGDGTRVEIIEDVAVRPAFERLRVRFLSQHRFIDRYATALAARLGAAPPR